MDDDVRRARALASPVRMRVLRICLHEPHTNKQISDVLGLSPATTLHHVRTLVDTGFLAPQEERRGNRGAREVPYLATRASLHTELDFSDVAEGAPSTTAELLVATTLDELRSQPPFEAWVARLGVKMSPEKREGYVARINAIVDEMLAEPTDPEGEPWSALVVLHPDPQAD